MKTVVIGPHKNVEESSVMRGSSDLTPLSLEPTDGYSVPVWTCKDCGMTSEITLRELRQSPCNPKR